MLENLKREVENLHSWKWLVWDWNSQEFTKQTPSLLDIKLPHPNISWIKPIYIPSGMEKYIPQAISPLAQSPLSIDYVNYDSSSLTCLVNATLSHHCTAPEACNMLETHGKHQQHIPPAQIHPHDWSSEADIWGNLPRWSDHSKHYLVHISHLDGPTQKEQQDPQESWLPPSYTTPLLISIFILTLFSPSS